MIAVEAAGPNEVSTLSGEDVRGSPWLARLGGNSGGDMGAGGNCKTKVKKVNEYFIKIIVCGLPLTLKIDHKSIFKLTSSFCYLKYE